MQFMITAYDGTDRDAPARRRNARPRHLENIAKVSERGSVVCAGGITDGEGRPVGSFLILDFADRETLDAYLAGEPYVAEGVWQEIRVEPCSVVIVNDEMVGK